MNEKIEVLGTEIDNLSPREAMRCIKDFMNTDALSVVTMITSGILIEAEQSSDYRALIERLDLSVIGEKGILEAAGVENGERLADIQSNSFCQSLFGYMEREAKRIVLLAENESKKQEFLDNMKQQYPSLCMSEAFSLEGMVEDAVINQMNGVSADVILAALSSPWQEEFVFRNQQKLGAKLWIGCGKEFPLRKSLELKSGFLEKLIERMLLKKRAAKYQNEKDQGPVE